MATCSKSGHSGAVKNTETVTTRAAEPSHFEQETLAQGTKAKPEDIAKDWAEVCAKL